MSVTRAPKTARAPRSGSGSRGAFRQGRLALLLLLPSFVVVFGIVVYPLLRTLYTSLFDVNSAFPGTYPFSGLGNYLLAVQTAGTGATLTVTYQ